MWEGKKGSLIIECGSWVFFQYVSITIMQNYLKMVVGCREILKVPSYHPTCIFNGI